MDALIEGIKDLNPTELKSKKPRLIRRAWQVPEAQLSLKFGFNGSSFKNEAIREAYAASRPAALLSSDSLRSGIRFGDPYEKATAQRIVQNLRQGNTNGHSCSTTPSSPGVWLFSIMMTLFRYTGSTVACEDVQKVIRVDTAWREHRESCHNPTSPERVMQSRGNSPLNTANQLASQISLPSGEPMQLDSAHLGYHLAQAEKESTSRRRVTSSNDNGQSWNGIHGRLIWLKGVMRERTANTEQAISRVPPEYSDFSDLFQRSSHSPNGRPQNTLEPHVKMSDSETQALRAYLDENLAKGFIGPSSSPERPRFSLYPRKNHQVIAKAAQKNLVVL
ncbi:uncharacterized protein V1513DRAFT_469902 [Lipomyces chichibuensis]|uniref:uncharacterized protein n=1 Tax=Lipomyces chichibuensis TaxID=1546026 RepID=UPI0033430973